jgi:hypothetical protein
MKVKELMEKLKDEDPEADVFLYEFNDDVMDEVKIVKRMGDNLVERKLSNGIVLANEWGWGK